MKIIITGSEGFIGKKLKNEFFQDSELECLDIVKGHDLCKYETINNIGKFDLLIHLAALSYVPESFKNPKKFYDVNINSTLNALELCKKHNAKMLFISSYVYGKPEYLPIDEKHPLKAFNPYAQSKIIGEMLCEGYYRDFNVGCTILRPFNIYGKGQNESFLIPSIVRQIKSKQEVIELKDPNPRRDFIHIDDVVRAIKLSTDHIINNQNNLYKYNLASGKSYSVKEITEIINKLDDSYKNIKFKFQPSESRKNEVNETLGSFKKIKKEVGWEPKISFREGLIKSF